MEKEELFKSVFYGMCAGDIDEFMERFTERAVQLYPYEEVELTRILLRMHEQGYNVYFECKNTPIDVFAMIKKEDKVTIVGLGLDEIVVCDSVLGWDDIYEILQSNEDAMKFVLENTETEIPDEDLDTLCWFENRGTTHKFYEDAIQSLDVAIKELRECAEILHNLKF